jgi:SAM-dependent methyltransferase
MKQIEIPTTRPELKQLILDALKRRYISVSGDDHIETGNHYQSVTLGQERTSGFRSDRATFLDQIDFRGKRVLDLGANLGEISRGARARGAAVVDGYEYDPFFVELAQLLNAYNGTTRVSFHQRDIANPDTYRERYDIVLAFSVFTYIHRVLDRLASMTDEALIVETHKLDGNLENGYLAPVRKFLRVYEVLGESDWGRSLPSDQTRAVIVFARDQAALDRAMGRSGMRRGATWVDVRRTILQRLFFEGLESATGDALLSKAATMEIDLEQVAEKPDLATFVYSGRMYWFVLLKGYTQYLNGGVIGRGNIYYDYITDYYVPRRHDPALCDVLSDAPFAMQCIAARFRELDSFRKAPKTYVPTAISLFRSGMPASDKLAVYEVDSGEVLHACAVDGWHRLFAARVFGATAIPAEVLDMPTT